MSVESADTKPRISHRAWLVIGVLSGIIAFAFVPIAFGAVSVVSGVVVFRRHDERHGLALILFGLIAAIVGIVIGVWVWA